MTQLNEGISPIDFLSTTSSNLLMLCKELRELDPKHDPNDVIDGSFKITSFLNNPKAWYNCAENVVIPEIISHYLHLNLTFVEPNNDLDGTMGYINKTHASGPLKMIDMLTAIDQSYAINFIMKKQTNRILIGYSLKLFNFNLDVNDSINCTNCICLWISNVVQEKSK